MHAWFAARGTVARCRATPHGAQVTAAIVGRLCIWRDPQRESSGRLARRIAITPQIMWYLITAGILLIGVGAIFRFAPRVDRGSRWYWPAVVIGFVFGAAPRSWLPWGAALLLFGLGSNSSTIGLLLQLLSALLLVVGLIFLFHAPRWQDPRTLRDHKPDWPGR